MEPFSSLRAFTTTDRLQKALLNHYVHIAPNELTAKKYAYTNTLPFLHRYMQARRLLDSAQQSVVHIQPLLLYYSFTEFMKAIVLFYDPMYPSTTSVLQHGVSTRKRKKKDYRFIDDEVRIQRSGLFPLLNQHLFHVKLEEGERFNMSMLFSELSEMHIVLHHDPRLQNRQHNDRSLHPLLIHYLLLYNLSMICRYETEWWGELNASRISIDLTLIEHYLYTAPSSISRWIVDEMNKHLT